jgi:hypothetical protein
VLVNFTGDTSAEESFATRLPVPIGPDILRTHIDSLERSRELQNDLGGTDSL